eukprot:scaffold1924_cov218-Amphora_coffeaeformis.AAC.13
MQSICAKASKGIQQQSSLTSCHDPIPVPRLGGRPKTDSNTSPQISGAFRDYRVIYKIDGWTTPV